jgi:hypothetical protein
MLPALPSVPLARTCQVSRQVVTRADIQRFITNTETITGSVCVEGDEQHHGRIDERSRSSMETAAVLQPTNALLDAAEIGWASPGSVACPVARAWASHARRQESEQEKPTWPKAA